MLKIYCDGACSGNPGPGGWAFVIPQLNVEYSGFEPHTTNNRMEITSTINALKYVYEHHPECCNEVEIITDSQYVISTMTKNWKKNKNTDLWTSLEYYVWCFLGIKWTWVKGHSSNEYNNRCDELAVQEYEKRSHTVIDENSYKFEELPITNEEQTSCQITVEFHLLKKIRVQPGDRIYRLYECPNFLKDFIIVEKDGEDIVFTGSYEECCKHMQSIQNNGVTIDISHH